MKYIFVTFLISSGSGGFTQDQNVIDSLNKRLEMDMHDTEKVRTLNYLVEELLDISLDTATLFASSALSLSKKLEWELGIAESHNKLGNCYWMNGKLDEALKQFQSAFDIYEINDDKSSQSKLKGNMGIVYTNQAKYSKAVACFSESLKINLSLNHKPESAAAYSNLGIVYARLGENTKALELYFKALKINEEIGNKNFQAANWGNIAGILAAQEDYLKAIEYDEKALPLYRYLNNPRGIAKEIGAIGINHYYLNDNKNALKHLFEAIEIQRKLAPHTLWLTTLILLQVYMTIKKTGR